MTHAVTIGNATLYCGDAREIVPVLPERGRLGLSDVPYRLSSGGKNGNPRGMKGKFAHGLYDNGGEFIPCDISWPEIADVMARAVLADADAVVMANDKEIFKAQAAMAAAGFSLHNLFAWDKVTATPNRWGMKNLEFAVFMWKGQARALRDCSIKQLTRAPLKAESTHPTEKPVGLMQRWIEAATDPGELVIDPFMGSGTTGVAALRSGRRFVGIEIDKGYFQIARDRMMTALDQTNLFAEVGT